MLLELSITDDDIEKAERVLLNSGKQFDSQRRRFIQSFATLDLQAVPGSGKTTALLAKLISIDHQIPTKDNRGVLVLSHTNAAVEEIRFRIGHHCPNLFQAPNFIGTIQSFVDAFLAIPYYCTLYGKKPIRVDDELYRDFHHPDYRLKAFLDRRGDGARLLYEYTLRENDMLRLGTTDGEFPFKSHTETYRKILAIKKDVRDKGVLSFDDAYVLASEYLNKFPLITEILRSRFFAVFVDEMQDMERHQYDLIEQLFHAQDVVLQRIGDKNQAIYGDDNARDDFWNERNVIEINGSHRLSAMVASIVQSLALRPIAIQGQASYPDNTPIRIKPHIIVYNDATVSRVLQQYGSIIEGLIGSGQIPQSDTNLYKAVAWTTAKAGDNAERLKLNSFYPLFSKDQQTPKIAFECLESYIFNFNGSKSDFASIRKNILNSLLRVIRIEGILQQDGRPFTKRALADFVKANSDIQYLVFRTMIYDVCLLTIKEQREEAYLKLVELCSVTLRMFNKSVPSASRRFIITRHLPLQVGEVTKQAGEGNRYRYNDSISIDIGTVHSIKGQTHTCTLYLESFYQSHYESTRLAAQLKGGPMPASANSYFRQSAKMAYVGFSRPTHLLCFAVHQTRFEESLVDIDRDTWEVNTDLLFASQV